MDIKGGVVIVTGSATGVGAACAKLLASKGCNVVINYTRSKAKAEETARACEQHGAETIVFQGDVGEESACQGMAAAAVEKWGRIDYLINNAAKTKFNPYENLDGLTSEDFLAIYKVNVAGAYQMVRAVVPHMRKLGKGSIVNNSSIGGVTGIASSMAYAASKAALNMMTRTSAPDYVRDGIHMNAVDTGWVTDEDPAVHAARKAEEGFAPPLDIIDGAARIVDPIFSGVNTGTHVWGQFLKDYKPAPW